MTGFQLTGGLSIPAFGLALGIGASLGLAWVVWKSQPASKVTHLSAGLWMLIGCLVGGRAGEVAAGWEYYRLHLAQVFSLPQGGVTWTGALLGGAAALLVFAWRSGSDAGSLADGLVPLGTALFVSGWMACWLDGCAYGQPVEAWWAMPARDEWGNLFPRFPLQFVGALLALGFTALLEREAQRGWPAGLLACLWLAGTGLQTLALSFFRADPGLLAAGVRLDTWAAAAMTLAGVILGAYFYRTRKPSSLSR